jgi:hypothetical protein
VIGKNTFNKAHLHSRNMRIEYSCIYSHKVHKLLYPDVELVVTEVHCGIIRLEVLVERP